MIEVGTDLGDCLTTTECATRTEERFGLDERGYVADVYFKV